MTPRSYGEAAEPGYCSSGSLNFGLIPSKPHAIVPMARSSTKGGASRMELLVTQPGPTSAADYVASIMCVR